MNQPSQDDIMLMRQRYVGRNVDEVRDEIEQSLGRYELHIAPADTAFSMQMDPNRVRVSYDGNGRITEISQG